MKLVSTGVRGMRRITPVSLAILLFVTTLMSLVTVVLQTRDAHAADHLVAQWKFDETTAGTNAEDYVGSNDGVPGTQTLTYPTPSTNVAPVSFANPRSAEFNGQNYFTINNPVSTNFTICAWVKTSSTGGGVNHWTSAPIMDAEWGGVNYDFGFGVGNGGKLMFGNGGNPVGGGGLYDQQINGSTTINDDEWHNVCTTRNNTTGAVKLYVDAQLDGQGTTGVGSLNIRSVARIGWGYDGAALFEGLIDDVRVYDTDLAPEQLQALTDGADNPFDDNDGSSPAVEDGVPGGDGNDDGTADSQQVNVTSFVNTVTSKYATLAVPTQCQLSDVGSLDSTTLANDSGYVYSLGLLDFTANCGTYGFTATIQQYYYDPPSSGDFILRKEKDGVYQTIQGASFSRQTIGGNSVLVVSYEVTDGGEYDADGLVNGIIVDPAGPAQTVPGAPDTGYPRQPQIVLVAIMTLAIVIVAAVWSVVRLRR